MTAIETLGVEAVELTHASAQGRIRGFDQEVVVVGHLAGGEQRPVEAPTHLAKHLIERLAIRIVDLNRLLSITT